MPKTLCSKKLNKEYLLKESKNFCMAPWIHMHMWPSGETFPCCIVQPDENNKGMANFNDMTVKELWNCDTMRRIRLNMLNDKPSKECTNCYELEESGDVLTLRKDLTDRFSEKFYRVEQTHEDGSHDDPQFYYWDIRFNNLCNMKCRTCGPELSTSWWQDYPKNYNHGKNPLMSLTKKPTFWDEMRPFVNNIESVYFAGGEPLITDEHYTMLDIWLEQKKNDIHISYTTNFSRLKHKGKNVLDYWKQFKRVNVLASLDGSYKRGEWLRKGTRWSKIVSNRKEMKEALPNTMFGITPTVSVYNVWHLPDFLKEWIELDLVEVNLWSFRINLLTTPECMRIQVLPNEFKKEVEEKWLEFLNWLEIKGYSKEQHTEMFTYFNGIIKFMWKNDMTNEIPELLKQVNHWDKVRSENMFEVFPELGILKDYV